MAALKSRRMEEIQTSSSNLLPFPAEPQRQERGFWTRCEFPRTSQTRRGYLKPNSATTRSLILPFYMPGLLLSYFASLCLSTYKFQTGCMYLHQIYTQLWSKSAAEYQTSIMSLRYSMAFLTHMIGSSTIRHSHKHTPEQRFETAAAFLLAQGRGTLLSWTGGLPDKQRVPLLLTTTLCIRAVWQVISVC